MFKIGAAKDQAIAFANDTDLGTITVDVTAGIAQAAPAVGSLATTLPSGLQCPVGKWASDIFDPGVDPGPPSFTCLRSTYDQIIVLDPNGSLMMSHEAFDTFVPAPNDPAARVCGDMALPAQSVTFANGTLSYSFSDDPYSCPGKVAHVTATFNADCTVATANYQSTGCGECVAGSMGNDGCRGCGGVTCSTTTTPGASALILHKR